MEENRSKTIYTKILLCILLLSTFIYIFYNHEKNKIKFQSNYIKEIVFHSQYPLGEIPQSKVNAINMLKLHAEYMDDAAWKELTQFSSLSKLEIWCQSKDEVDQITPRLVELSKTLQPDDFPKLSSIHINTSHSIDLSYTEKLLQKAQSYIFINVETKGREQGTITLNPITSEEIECNSLTLVADHIINLNALEKWTQLEILSLNNHPLSPTGETLVLDIASLTSMPLISLSVCNGALLNEDQLSEIKTLKRIKFRDVALQNEDNIRSLPQLESIEINYS